MFQIMCFFRLLGALLHHAMHPQDIAAATERAHRLTRTVFSTEPITQEDTVRMLGTLCLMEAILNRAPLSESEILALPATCEVLMMQAAPMIADLLPPVPAASHPADPLISDLSAPIFTAIDAATRHFDAIRDLGPAADLALERERIRMIFVSAAIGGTKPSGESKAAASSSAGECSPRQPETS